MRSSLSFNSGFKFEMYMVTEERNIQIITITRVSDLIVQYLYHENTSIMISLVFCKYFNFPDPFFPPHNSQVG